MNWWLQKRHPLLRVTLFTTPDWRTLDPYPSRKLLTRIPILRDHLFTVRVHRTDTFRLDRHESEWTDGFLASLPPLVTDWEMQNGDRM